MPRDRRLSRHVADILRVDPNGEFLRLGQCVESGRLSEGRVDQRLLDAMSAQIIEADVLEGPAQFGTEPFARSGQAREVGCHVEEREGTCDELWPAACCPIRAR